MIAPFRRTPAHAHDDLVILGRVVLDLVMGAVVLSLVCVGVFIVGGAVVAALTLLRARSRSRRRHSRLSRLNLGYHGAGIYELDEALDRILAEERGAPWPL